MNNIKIPKYTNKEEILNSLSHGLGCLLFIHLFYLMGKNCSIYSLLFSISLIFLYLISFIYHGLPKKNYLKKLFRLIDHCNVFILETTTFIPICFLVIGGSFGLIYFLFILILNIIGVLLNYFKLDKVQLLSVVFHLVIGWSIILFLPLLLNKIGFGTFYLFFGGFLYSIGVIFYRLGVYKRYFHFIFHLFCLVGSLCHFIMVYLYII